MDITSITSAYTAIKSIKEIGSNILESRIDSEVKEKISDTMSKLGDIQDTLFFIREELIKTQDENYELKNEVRILNEKLADKKNVDYFEPLYWKVIDEEKKDGPFCQRCFDVDDKLVRVQGNDNDEWSCRECNSYYRGKNYNPPSPPKRSSNNSIRPKWRDRI